jgi:hypothetical protein
MYFARLKILALIFFINLFVSCDAPRRNPLDPKNPDAVLLTISGIVQTISIPYVPISDAQILWQGGQISSYSKNDGRFLIETVEKQDDWLYIEKSGFFHDSVFISWFDKKEIELTIFLNSQPVAVDLSICSSVLNRYPDLQNEQLFINIQITDRDEDIDSVFISNPYSDFYTYLFYNSLTQSYEKSLSNSDMNIDQLEEILGHPFDVTVTDRFEHKISIAQLNLVRVIREEIFFKSPSGNETTSSRPTLSWQKYTPGFQHYYMLEIYTAEITPQLVWQKNNISQNLTEYTLNQDLNPGEYFWVIWAIDEFQNRIRSKPASFRVVL